MSGSPADRPRDLRSLERVSIVGGAGFIGLNLLRRLLAEGLHVTVVDPQPINPAAVRIEDVDCHETISAEALRDSSVVFHVAGSTEPASSNIHLREDMTGTVGLTLEVIEAATAAGVERLIHVSSGGTIYGASGVVPTPETAVPDPLCAYGISKLAAERHVQLAERLHGLRGFNLRVSNPYGAWQDPQRGQGVVNAFLYRGLRGQPVELWGDGEIVRDFLHVDDVVEALCRTAVYPGTDRIFNIGSGIGRSVAEVIADLESLTEGVFEVNRHPGREVDVPRSVLDIERARRELGWCPRVDWNDGLRSTRDWMMNHLLRETPTS